MYAYYKKRRNSRHWWRRIQSRKFRRELIIRSILVLITTVTTSLLAFLNRGLYVLCFLAWCCIVGIIIIPFMMHLQVPKTQRPKSPRTNDLLQSTKNEKEIKITPTRIIPISQQKQLKKDNHIQSTKGMA